MMTEQMATQIAGARFTTDVHGVTVDADRKGTVYLSGPMTGLPEFNYPTFAAAAERLVYGDRGASYGHPRDDYTRTAQMWSAILGTNVTPEQAIMCMIAVKLSREVNAPKRDNRTDIAGYALCLDRVETGL